MENTPLIEISNAVEFRGRHSLYKFQFYNTHLSIKDDIFDTEIDYSDLYKIKYTSKSIKLIFKDSTNNITIYCTAEDLKKFKTLFKSMSKASKRECEGSAKIEFGNLSFFISIKTTDINELKSTIIRRIAKFFYPTCIPDEIAFGKFNKFKFCVKDDGKEIDIESSEDLDAMLKYFHNRLNIIILSGIE